MSKNSNVKMKQSELVFSVLRSNKRRSMTSEKVCENVNNLLKTKFKGRTRFTKTQISKCLNDFKRSNRVIIAGKGTTATGRKVNKWQLIS